MDMVSRIREEMEAQGIKQKDLVQRLGASQSNVSKWLSKNEKILMSTALWCAHPSKEISSMVKKILIIDFIPSPLRY